MPCFTQLIFFLWYLLNVYQNHVQNSQHQGFYGGSSLRSENGNPVAVETEQQFDEYDANINQPENHFALDPGSSMLSENGNPVRAETTFTERGHFVAFETDGQFHEYNVNAHQVENYYSSDPGQANEPHSAVPERPSVQRSSQLSENRNPRFLRNGTMAAMETPSDAYSRNGNTRAHDTGLTHPTQHQSPSPPASNGGPSMFVKCSICGINIKAIFVLIFTDVVVMKIT